MLYTQVISPRILVKDANPPQVLWNWILCHSFLENVYTRDLFYVCVCVFVCDIHGGIMCLMNCFGLVVRVVCRVLVCSSSMWEWSEKM